jgi:hypothetical protein
MDCAWLLVSPLTNPQAIESDLGSFIIRIFRIAGQETTQREPANKSSTQECNRRLIFGGPLQRAW